MFKVFLAIVLALVLATNLAASAFAPSEHRLLRQGGDLAHWGGTVSAGTTTYEVPQALTQAGSIAVPAAGATITFPAPFRGVPLIFFQAEGGARAVEIQSLSATQARVRIISVSDTPAQTGGILYWQALGEPAPALPNP